MENATKALLIAAAILIAILVISLGIVVYQMAAETVDGINFSSQEVDASNEQFTRYNGKHRRGSEVNAMLKTVLSSNVKANSTGESAKLVSVYMKDNTGASSTLALGTSATSLGTQADTSALYTVTVNYGGPGGLVDTITVTKE